MNENQTNSLTYPKQGVHKNQAPGLSADYSSHSGA
jgi:hypothetical protein